jgi:two-component system chemotaxis response regulator CheY
MNTNGKFGSAKTGSRPEQRARVVLLADDDADWRLLVKDALLQSHIPGAGPLKICEAGDGAAALRHLMCQGDDASLPPDLVYLDFEMPEMDGISVLEAVRNVPRLRKIPIVMLTGVLDESSVRRACDLGAAAYIPKPANLDDLKRVISASAGYWLSLAQRRARAGKERRGRGGLGKAA